MDKMQPQDKDVVIIGNGPSGICLSYLLAGNWPHYTGSAHPGDEMLTARLRHGVATRSNANDDSTPCRTCRANNRDDESRCFGEFCKREDLEFLSAGLEGRNGGKPLSLLMDQLQHPCLDAGMDEESLLDWRSPEQHNEHALTDHVVLGRGPPGGAWHTLDPNVLTISLNRWMSLPGLDLRGWASSLDADELRRKLAARARDTATERNAARVPIGTVAAYYRDYVRRQGLDRYFRCGTVVTSVRPTANGASSAHGWIVQGYESDTTKQFEYRCKRVVLATGTTDSTNRLGISGEDTYNWVTHDFKDFERKLDKLSRPVRKISDSYDSDEIKSSSVEPVLIVGSGLSAADAIMAARSRGVPVVHVFRNSSKDKGGERKRSLDRLRWLPASVYPEYHEVYEMMADRGRNYPLYKSLADHVAVDFSVGADKLTRTKTRKVTLCSPQGRLVSYRVSFAAVLIGSKPDLSFLRNNGCGLGKLADKPIDSRANQIDVDPFTYEVVKAPRRGLYAVGPLAGDNFVRFILGGAFGVLASILNADEH